MTRPPVLRLPGTAERILAPRDTLDYFDSRGIDLPRPVTPLEAWTFAMARPIPGLALAFRIRDAISARFGVARTGGFSGTPRDTVAAGDRLDFFLVEETTPEALVLTARDRHLDVMACLSVEGCRLTLTASVCTHNTFGRLYMLPVGPAHRVIADRMLRNVASALEAETEARPRAILATMPITAIYANLSCADLARSRAWYERVFDRVPDATPMEGLHEWHLGASAGFQLFHDAQKAGQGTVTLFADDLDAARARLAAAGPDLPEPQPGGPGRILQLRDPDGNLVVLVEPA
ncbi:DUF2867 domain-containing protein [Jannaschia marina]|uniref:DUF2867 domain-containing protein n=1 Tax=Jannaschia marina TaxID=2741674 RepID=UPI002E28DF7A|nr:DUF2867 domain-containing protein [Jannaschia marina]